MIAARARSLLGLLVLAAFAIAVPARAQDIVVDPSDFTSSKVADALNKKGKDWLKGQAKSAGKDWIFDTGQSETMQAILDAALNRANSDGNDVRAGCKGAVMGKASSILSDLHYKTNVKVGGKLMFDTATKMAGLASGLGGAIAEGGAINWLAGQYTSAATGKAKDSAFDKIKKLFIDEHKPQFEIYETSGQNGPCEYKLHAVWDIVHGTYTVLISGDCHCQPVGNVGVAPQKLGKWWISFSGHLKLDADVKAETAKWIVLPVDKMDSDAQCDCSTRELRQPYTETPPPCAPPPSAPPLSPDDRKKIQSAIDEKKKARADIADQLRDAADESRAAQDNLNYDKAHPKSDPEAQKREIEKDQKRIDEAKEAERKLQADDAKLQKELGPLQKQLDGTGPACPPPGTTGVSFQPPPSETVALTSFAQEIVDVHNAVRSEYNDPPMQWDQGLADIAQPWAQALVDRPNARTTPPQHSPRTGRGIARESIAQGLPWWTTRQLLQTWIDERGKFRPGKFPDVSTTGNWYEVGHWTQMIWYESVRVGCARAVSAAISALVCEYSPGGNKDGQPVGYKVEQPPLSAADNLTGPPAAPPPPPDWTGAIDWASGDFGRTSIYDLLDFGDDDGLSGFVGGGVGVARVDYNNVRAFSNQAAVISDSDSDFVRSVLLGVPCAPGGRPEPDVDTIVEQPILPPESDPLAPLLSLEPESQCIM